MRRIWILLLCLAFVATVAPAHATSVTVVLSGEWFAVDDTANVLDGSVVVGGSFTATLVYDDSAADLDPSTGFGAYFTPAASSDLSVLTGNYTFTPGSDVGVGVENDNAFGEDWIYLDAEDYTASGPLPGGIGTGATAYLSATLTDYSAAAQGSDALVGLNWALSAYDDSFVYLFIEVTGAGPLQYIELQGTIENIALLPEPSVVGLACVGCAALIATRRRG